MRVRQVSEVAGFVGVLWVAAVGCYDERTSDAAAMGGRAVESEPAPELERSDASVPPAQGSDAGEGDAGVVLECERGAVADLHVEFECADVTVYTCKDLSNLVIEFEDGTRERFEGQSGQVNRLGGTGANAGKRIVRVWVKAGANHSGEGPGYGQRVETTSRPEDCTPPAAGSGGGGGAAGGCVEGPDVPCSPIPTGGVGGAGAGGADSPAGPE